MFRNAIAIFGITLASFSSAHFFIKIPAPIPGSAIWDPLEASGSNFPCHGVDLSSPITRTVMAVGSNQPLRFDLGNGRNTAVHGGGSCQISITYETDPAKVKDPTNWKVIKSYIGGCPTDSKGNLPLAVACNGKNSPDCVNNLSFDIPPEVKNGNAILAWTWFNNIGNREMFMNCAAVSFTGGQDQLNTLPSIFIANLAGINQCRTTESTNTDIPNPGKYVQKNMPLNYPLNSPVECGINLDLNITQASAEPESVQLLRTGTTVKTIYNDSAEMLSNGNIAVRPCRSGAIACLTPGFFCINDTTYGECAYGCAIPMQMALGTKCVDNAIFSKSTRLLKRSRGRFC